MAFKTHSRHTKIKIVVEWIHFNSIFLSHQNVKFSSSFLFKLYATINIYLWIYNLRCWQRHYLVCYCVQLYGHFTFNSTLSNFIHIRNYEYLYQNMDWFFVCLCDWIERSLLKLCCVWRRKNPYQCDQEVCVNSSLFEIFSFFVLTYRSSFITHKVQCLTVNRPSSIIKYFLVKWHVRYNER